MEEAVTSAPGEVLERVERELQACWSSPPATGETPKTRARTRNLVVVAGTPELASRWASIIDEVLQTIPARAIVVGLDPDGGDALEASAAAVYMPAGSGSDAVCSERVTLVVRGAVCTRLASCVETLRAADVPTTLVWLGRVHADDPAFAPLARDADKIILDAAQGSLASVAQVVRWAGARPANESPGVGDLAWTRLSAWQDLCARMFDEPLLRELPWGMTRVEIVQASPAGAPLGCEGGLLLGWLATRLGWKATSLGGKLRLLRRDPHRDVSPQGTVRALLRADPAAKAPRSALLALQVEAKAGDLTMRGAITREPGDAPVAIWRREVQGRGEPERIEQRVRLGTSEPAPLLEETLRRARHDEALAASVTWADELRGEELACG
jgi:glucose-6-phosphate dehydrogenase assembly protein OpcA